MEQIIITKKDTTTWPLMTRSAVSSVTRAEQRRTLLGEDIIAMTVNSSTVLQFAIGDKITIFGSIYILNELPKHHKAGKRNHIYDLTWEGRQYDLLKPIYLDTGEDEISISPDFPLTGNLEFFLDVLINNANRIFGTGVWVKGDCPETDYRTLTFSNENCLAVLQRLCKPENFGMEFEIVENSGVFTINIKDAIGETLSEVYEYGKGKGLWDLTRETVSDKNIITRLYVFGANKNLASDYRGFSQRLKLPGNDLSYIEDSGAISTYGLIEGVKIFDEIFPHRTGTVSSLGSSVLEFIDSGMDFDLNATDEGGNTLYLISGVPAKIHFNTGNLAGYEFTMSYYNNSLKKFTLQAFTDERGQVFPDGNSSAFQITVGDKYVITDIRMPDSYITTAETALETAGNDYYDLVSQPRVQYSQTFDELYFMLFYEGQSIQNVFNIGDYIHIKDTDINVDKSIRLRSFKRDVLRPYKYDLDLYDYSEETIAQKLISASNETSKIISSNNLDNVSGTYRKDLLIDSLNNCLVIMDAGLTSQYLKVNLPLSVDKIGIGTSSPWSKLNLAGSAETWGTSPSITLTDTEGNAGSRNWLIGNVAVDQYGDLNFAVSGSDGGTPTNTKVTFQKGGNVGIGTLSPATKLELAGALTINPSAAASDYIIFKNNSTSIGIVGSDSAITGNDPLEMGLYSYQSLSLGTNGYRRILIGSGGSIGLPAFTSGFQGSGWEITKNGSQYSFEVDNMRVRGGLQVYELIINQLHYQNGGLIIGAGAGKVKSIYSSTYGSEQIYFETPQGTSMVPFSIGAIIMMQRVDIDRSTILKKIVRQVNAIQGDGRIDFTTTSGWTTGNDIGIFAVGDEICTIGHTSTSSLQNSIYLSATDSDNPFLRVFAGVNSYSKWSLSDKSTIKLQIGNLASLANYNDGFMTLPSSPGYGIYTNNAYISGAIHSTTGFIGGFTLSSHSLTATVDTFNCSIADNGIFSMCGLEFYNYSQQTTPVTLTGPMAKIYVCLDNNVESTLNLPSSGLPGNGTAQMLIINHKYGTGLGINKYHIQGNGYYIIKAGVQLSSFDLAEGHTALLIWEPRGSSWYVVST